MSGSLIVLIIALILGGVAYWFGLRNPEQSVENMRWLMLFEWLLTFFLLINIFITYLGYRSVRALIETEPTTSLASWQRHGNQEDVVLVGKVSQNNAVLRDDNVAVYIECSGPCDLQQGQGLLIALNGGDVRLEEKDYEDRDWVYQRGMTYSYYDLFLGDDIVVVGQSVIMHNLSGDTSLSLDAEVVYRGDYDAFVQRAKARQWLPLGLMMANAVGAVLLLMAGLAYVDLFRN